MPGVLDLSRVMVRWDGSQIYGKNKDRAKSLRVEGNECELRLDENGSLPLGPNGLPEGG